MTFHTTDYYASVYHNRKIQYVWVGWIGAVAPCVRTFNGGGGVNIQHIIISVGCQNDNCCIKYQNVMLLILRCEMFSYCNMLVLDRVRPIYDD